jgi:chaperonin cofactor prefoldin
MAGVYILSNPAHPYLKIGRTDHSDPSARVADLNSHTGVPLPHKVVDFIDLGAVETARVHAVEQATHRWLAERGHRVRENREFFACTIDLAYVALHHALLDSGFDPSDYPQLAPTLETIRAREEAVSLAKKDLTQQFKNIESRIQVMFEAVYRQERDEQVAVALEQRIALHAAKISRLEREIHILENRIGTLSQSIHDAGRPPKIFAALTVNARSNRMAQIADAQRPLNRELAALQASLRIEKTDIPTRENFWQWRGLLSSPAAPPPVVSGWRPNEKQRRKLSDLGYKRDLERLDWMDQLPSAPK